MLVGRTEEGAVLSTDRHPADLERLAADALSAGDVAAAFAYADRRCRIVPAPRAHCYVLRADAAWQLGHKRSAIEDIDQALAISPQDLTALQRLFAWTSDDRRRSIASRLIAHDRNPTIIKAAISDQLEHTNEHRWAAISVFDAVVTGWIAWTGKRKIEVRLTLESGTLSQLIDANPFHALSSRRVSAASFTLRRPASLAPQYVEVLCDGATVLARRLAPNAPSSISASLPAAKPCDEHVPATVIVPVYGDREATIACFESLLLALREDSRRNKIAPFRILAVDDASPDPDLKSYLRKLAASGEVELLTNTLNLGFVGAINRALDQTTTGDVVLLNADTLVPPGFVERLRTTAHSDPAIGTATPLSNNGDIFSFPRANTVNPMRSYDEVVAVDRLTAKTNAGIAVEVPSGIGFCLYIKRNCLDAVGGLSERFERGYLEDVDFCLRARAKGYRNVCAASVYVGHHGSKSFGKQKRDLVLRNLGVIEYRFPSYLKECRAFESADPLQPVRASLERETISEQGLVLIATGPGPGLAIARVRTRQLQIEGKASAILTCYGDRFVIEGGENAMPQAPWVLDRTRLSEAITGIKRLRPARLEILDATIIAAVADLLSNLEIRAEYWLGAGFEPGSDGMIGPKARLVAPTEQAFLWARRAFGKRPVVRKEWETAGLALGPLDRSRPRALAVVSAAPSASSWQVVRALAHRFYTAMPSLQIVIAGETFSDTRLMSYPNVFITGAVSADELADVFAPHNVGWLMTDFDAPLFGHPLQETARLGNRPVAYRDWSDGGLKARNEDLPLPPSASPSSLANSVLDWIAGS